MDDFAPTATEESTAHTIVEDFTRLRAAARFTTIAGSVYAILFLVSYWLLLEVPRSGASESDFQSFYSSDQSDVVTVVALYLLPFAGIAFLWFIVSVRMWIGLRKVRPINLLFSNIQLVSGIVFLSLLFCSTAALSMGPVTKNFSNVDGVPLVALEFSTFGGSLFFVFATRMGAMFVFTTTKVCRDAGIIPGWFTISSFLVGLIMLLTASFNRGMIVVFPCWVLVLCLLTQLHVRDVLQNRMLAREEHETIAEPAVTPEGQST